MFDDESDYEEPSARREDQAIEVRATAPPAAASHNLPEMVRLGRELGPRDMVTVIGRAKEIGGQLGRILDPNPKSQGTGAYYRWSQGGSIIEGPTIDLMQALVLEWGRLVYEVDLVAQVGNRVTLRARVIDLMSLVITSRESSHDLRPAPKRFAKKAEEAERWRSMQLNSAQSKAVRGVLEDVIPLSVIEAALEAAREAAASMQLGTTAVLDAEGKPVQAKGKDGKPVFRDGKPVYEQRRRTLAEAVGAAVKALSSLHPPPDLALVERWLGRPRAEWVASDLAALRGLYDRWRRGELTPESFAAEVAQASDDESEGAPAADRLDSLGLGSGASPASSPSPGAGAAGAGAPSAGAATLLKRAIADDLDIIVRAVEAAGGMLHLATARDKLIRPDVALTEEHWAAVLALGQQAGRIAIVGGTTLSLPASGAPSTSRSTAAEDLEVLTQVLQAAGQPLAIEQAKERFKAASSPVIRKLVAVRWDPIVALGVQLGRLVVTGNVIDLPSSTPPAEPDPIDEMSLGELKEECDAIGADLGPDVFRAALAQAGIPQTDGAPEPRLRALLRLLVAQLPDADGDGSTS